MPTPSHQKLVSNSFDKLHEQISALRSHVEALEDPEARRWVHAMESGLLAPMRNLRRHLGIPYDWHEAPADTEERLTAGAPASPRRSAA